MIFPSWSSLSLSAPWGESHQPYGSVYIQCLWAVPAAGHPPPFQAVGAHTELWCRQRRIHQCFPIFHATWLSPSLSWWTHGVHYGLPHLETAYVQLSCKPSGSPVQTVGSLMGMGLLAFGEETSLGGEELPGQPWQLAAHLKPASGKSAKPRAAQRHRRGRAGTHLTVQPKSWGPSRLEPLHYCNPTGWTLSFLNSFLCHWWT